MISPFRQINFGLESGFILIYNSSNILCLNHHKVTRFAQSFAQGGAVVSHNFIVAFVQFNHQIGTHGCILNVVSRV